uniref:Glucosaminyl (N-acetyl) transferase family member 7 n=1 Tax=Rhinopithecus roxellana TaxID=61622 RepID=A0A2K6QAG9_RHIRO
MSQLQVTKSGLVVSAVICIFIFLYLRNPTPAELKKEPVHSEVVECGFYPDELCSALSEGKGAAPQIAKFCKTPHKSEIHAHLHTPGNCSRISRGLHFITRSLSTEEGDFSLAYIITIHKELAMFVQLLRAIYVPQNVYCIHVDEKKMAYAGFTRLQADINCMKDLVHSKFQWNYVINLCGQDFPIKTNREIIHYIRSKWNDKNITPGVIQPPHIKSKTSQSHLEFVPEENVYAPPNNRFKDKPPHNFTIYFGSAYYVLTRKFVEFILTDIRAKDMLQWFKDIHSPEQHYWVTLNQLKDAPGATPDAGWEGNVRAIKWKSEEGNVHDRCKGRYVQDICVYGPGDLPWLIQSSSLFANKFEPSTDPLVVTCLERRHRLQVLRQAEVPIEPHWHFQQQSHFNMRLNR